MTQLLHRFKQSDNRFYRSDATLVGKLLPDLSTNYIGQRHLLAIITLSHTLHQQIKSGQEELRNSDMSDNNFNDYIKWSYNQLNLVIAAMASICRNDNQLFFKKTSHSFQFVDIFYKLKQLKVLSFLAIQPQPPIELLSTIINETFLWTEPTQLNTSVMQLHSRLVAQYSNCINDNRALQSYMTHNFLFELKECINFVSVNFQSFIDYLTEAIGKTQIDLVLDNWSPTLVSRLDQFYPDCKEFFEQLVNNRSLLLDEDFLIDFVKKSDSIQHTLELDKTSVIL